MLIKLPHFRSRATAVAALPGRPAGTCEHWHNAGADDSNYTIFAGFIESASLQVGVLRERFLPETLPAAPAGFFS